MGNVHDKTASERRHPVPQRPRIVIAGGGVAALEALIALRDLLDGLVSIDIVAPTDEFVYRPLSVAEPFGMAEPHRFDLGKIAADHGAELHHGIVESVAHDRTLVSVRGGRSLTYEVLLVAVGARPRDWLPGAISFAGPEDVPRLRALVRELDAGTLNSIVFTAPASTWTLPLYELALLTAARIGERGLGGIQLTVVTPEAGALEVFGPAASRHVRELCANRAIALKTAARALSLEHGNLKLEPNGDLQADRVVALPELKGEPIPGLPHDHAGFIPVDKHGAVRGLPGVYAAGDGTAHPIKQGGLAAQQADAAAEAIAARLGAAVAPQPFRPMLRGQLLTGLAPVYLTAGASRAGPRESSVAVNPLWWPPSKIAGRYLAPYLTRHISIGAADQLVERAPLGPKAAGQAAHEHREARELAVAFAESDAARADYRSALNWLETVEQLDGLLSPAHAAKRAQWRRQANHSARDA
jgi:sulfide:quinone oxidoreductase